MSDAVSVLRRVSYLAKLDEATLSEIASRARTQRFGRGARIVSELESGADVFVIMNGQADVTVDVR